MKINTLYTSLAIVGVASAAAVNKEARLQKRALEIVTVTDVVWDVVTVTQYEDQSTSTVVVTQAAAAGTPLAVTSTTTPAAAAAVQATSTSASAVVAEAVQAIKSSTSSGAATTVAVVPTTTAVIAGNVAPAAVTTTSTTPAAAAVTPSTTSATPAAAAATTASTTSTSASSYSGEATFYELGLTACGQTYVDTDYVAAISYKLFDQGGTANPNNNPHCGKKIAVLRNGKTVDVTIVDRCAGCEGEYDVDLSPVAFNTIASASEGRVGITWTYV